MSMSQKQWAETKVLHALLQPLYPDLLSLERPVPFKIGLHRDLMRAHGLRYQVARRLLGWLSFRRAYLASCTEGAARYGLDGPSGTVCAEQAEYSKGIFEIRNARAEDPWPEARAA